MVFWRSPEFIGNGNISMTFVPIIDLRCAAFEVVRIAVDLLNRPFDMGKQWGVPPVWRVEQNVESNPLPKV